MAKRISEDALHKAVCDRLIEATPEWWKYAELEIARTPGRPESAIRCRISNPDHPEDVVEPHDELAAAVQAVLAHFDKKKHVWNRIVYEIHQRPDSRWSFSVSVDYD